jgi:hypothetical protein
MQDAVQPENLRSAATTSILGGTRLVTFDPRLPPVSRPAMLALQDIEDHELKVSGIKRFVKLMGQEVEEKPTENTEPFVRRPPVGNGVLHIKKIYIVCVCLFV